MKKIEEINEHIKKRVKYLRELKNDFSNSEQFKRDAIVRLAEMTTFYWWLNDITPDFAKNDFVNFESPKLLEAE